MLDHPDPAAAPGLRRSTQATRHAAALADGYRGLPDGVTRWRLAAALRAAARPLGLTGPMLRLLEHYIDLTYDDDWAADSEPVVTRPLVEIAEHLGRTERQVRNVERALVERGLLAWRDSGNHHRKGRRDRQSGRLVYAYGPSLAPLGARASEILATAQAARAEIATSRRLRIAISALRRRIRADLSAAAAGGFCTDDLATQFAASPSRVEAGLGLATLAARRDALAAIADALAARLRDEELAMADADDVEISTKPEILSAPITDTCKKNAMNGSCIALEKPTVAKVAPRGDRHGSDRLPLAVAVAAAGPELVAAMARHGPTSWPGLVAGAAATAPLLGITPALWRDACSRLGRYGAALAVLVIERRATTGTGSGTDGPVRNPPAYLRGMIGRADTGTLHLDRSVRAWAQRGETG